MTPRTELPRDFCVGIGPLQFGVVLVFFFQPTVAASSRKTFL